MATQTQPEYSSSWLQRIQVGLSPSEILKSMGLKSTDIAGLAVINESITLKKMTVILYKKIPIQVFSVYINAVHGC